jgi:integrase
LRRSSPSPTSPPRPAAPTSRPCAASSTAAASTATLTVNRVTVAVTAAGGGRAPATWNRHLATVRAFLGFCRQRRWLPDDLTVDLQRRREPADRTKAIPFPELERLWRRDDLGVREKALSRFLYETAARATEALSVNIEDLDLDNKRVRVRSTGVGTGLLTLALTA